MLGPALLRSRPGRRVGQAGGCLVKGSFLFLFVRHRVWRRWAGGEGLLQTGMAKKVRTEANQNFLFLPSKDFRPGVFESHVCLVFFSSPHFLSCSFAIHGHGGGEGGDTVRLTFPFGKSPSLRRLRGHPIEDFADLLKLPPP